MTEQKTMGTVLGYRAAGYERLSKEDGDKLESDSIMNQRRLICEYAAGKAGVVLEEHYVDDGYSGSNFERPGFLRLMEDINQGKINCIIVKDLSRFGRNYIEMGRYLERIFPAIGVRLIAINDQYDGAEEWSKSDSIMVPFKNLMNDMYCREMSYKIRSQLEVKRQHGECISNFAAYGYRKDEKQRTRLVPDEEAAATVRHIFSWFISGMSVQAVANRLNASGILSPLEYKRSRGEMLAAPFRQGDKALWSDHAVRRILENEVYVGHLVQGKRKRVSYRMKKDVYRPREEWTRVENVHEAIVDQRQFALVQDVLHRDRRTSPGEVSLHPLSGFVICGTCHENMVMRRIRRKNKTYEYFQCSSYKRDRSCSSHSISVQLVEQSLLNAIQKAAKCAVNMDDMKALIRDYPQGSGRVKMLDGQIQHLKEQTEVCRRMRQRAYEDYMQEALSQDEYLEFAEEYLGQMKRYDLEMQRMMQQRQQVMSEGVREAEWVQDFLSHEQITHLTRALVVELLNYITIYEDKRMEITFRFADYMEVNDIGACEQKEEEPASHR